MAGVWQSSSAACSAWNLPRAGALSNGIRHSGQTAPPQDATGLLREVGTKNSWTIFLFLIAIIVPWVIYVGPLRLSMYRFVLLITFIPCIFMWITGRIGRIRTVDILIVTFSLWSMITLIVNHGIASVAVTTSIETIETLCPYLLGRCYIRNENDFRNAVRLLFIIVMLLMPFCIIELVSGHNVLLELFGTILPTAAYTPVPRNGLTRVSSVFDHPIMTGLYTGSILGLVHLVLGYQKSVLSRGLMGVVVVVTAFTSLSAGPIGAVALQILLLLWNGLLRWPKYRWKILIGLLVTLFILIEIVAKRSALNIITSMFIFDDASYWYRTLIWTYGSASVVDHPLFGVGLNDWPRPAWMPPSIDNFWLFQAIRSGLPAPILFMLCFFGIVLAVGFKRGLDDKVVECRTGFLITMTFFFLTGWTVAFWDSVYVLFLFLMGSGVWILDAQATDVDGSRKADTKRAAWGVEVPTFDQNSSRVGANRARSPKRDPHLASRRPDRGVVR